MVEGRRRSSFALEVRHQPTLERAALHLVELDPLELKEVVRAALHFQVCHLHFVIL